MTKLSDYTTEELERLTTLASNTELVSCGEYVTSGTDVVFLRTEEKVDGWLKFIRRDGGFGLAPNPSYQPVRRVTSFTDPTELDPPQADMLAELERRKRPVVRNATHAGRRVKHPYSACACIVVDAFAAGLVDKANSCLRNGHVAVIDLKDGHLWTPPAEDLTLLD